jgi:vacuolar protein sorting-associated protein 51
VTTSGLARTASIASASSATSDTSVATSNTLTHNNGASETSPLLTSLDAPDFDPQSFITHLLSTSSLRDILKTESALVSEIRTLDGERKALVYDNYSKLIKAVGTIGEMQKGMVRRDSADASYSTYSSKLGAQLGVGAKGGLDGVEALQEKLGGLEAEVRALRMSEEEVKEAEKYEEELRARKKVQGQRELVRWVLGSPERLEHVVDREEREMEWARVKMLLDRWEGVPGVDEVRKRGKEVMRRKAMETEKLQEEDET